MRILLHTPGTGGVSLPPLSVSRYFRLDWGVRTVPPPCGVVPVPYETVSVPYGTVPVPYGTVPPP